MTSNVAIDPERTVIVTGAGRGIGAVIAQRFVDDGAAVFAFDRAFEHEMPAGAVAVECDITSDLEVAAAVATVRERTGRIDVLINNAGINIVGALADVDLEEFRVGLDVNVIGLLRMCQAVIPAMKAAGAGRIINAASFAAIVPAVGAGAYAASKSAVVQLTRALAGELGPWNITVNAYAPGMIPTSINGFAEMGEVAQSELLDTLSLRRWGDAGDVASLVAFLAGAEAGYITGALIDVSGGKLATQIPSRAYELR